MLLCSLCLQAENLFHGQPLLARLRLRKWVLEAPHQFFPLSDLWVSSICTRFRLTGKPLIHFHDHEHAGAQAVDLEVLDARILYAARDLGPDLLVILLIFRDQLRIILQVQREAIALRHSYCTSSAGRPLSVSFVL